jgi:hypothetical protein
MQLWHLGNSIHHQPEPTWLVLKVCFDTLPEQSTFVSNSHLPHPNQVQAHPRSLPRVVFRMQTGLLMKRTAKAYPDTVSFSLTRSYLGLHGNNARSLPPRLNRNIMLSPTQSKRPSGLNCSYPSHHYRHLSRFRSYVITRVRVPSPTQMSSLLELNTLTYVTTSSVNILTMALLLPHGSLLRT